MKDLLKFILSHILPPDIKFEIEEKVEEDVVSLSIKTDEENAGLIIGKSGRIIKAIRSILRIKATLEHKKVVISVN